MSFDFPNAPTNGQVYSPSGGPDYVWNASTPGWEIKTSGLNSAYVAKAGDQMTGPLKGVSGNAINGVSGTPRSMFGTTVDSNRWELVLGDATPEGANNAGSDFRIRAFSNTGVLIYTPMILNRSTGSLWLNGVGATIPDFSLASAASGTANINLNKATGASANNIWGLMNSKVRWNMVLGSVQAEAGSNVGSDFQIIRYDDNGNPLSTPVQIIRSNGSILLSPLVTMTGQGPTLTLDRSSAAGASLRGKNAGKDRWALEVGSSDVESGGNVGSDFTVIRYNDAGTFVDVPLRISRNNGTITAPNNFVVGSVDCTNAMTVRGGCFVPGGMVTITAGAAGGVNPVAWFRESNGTNRMALYFDTANGFSTWLDNYSGANITMDTGGNINFNAKAGSWARANGNFSVGGAIDVAGTASLKGFVSAKASLEVIGVISVINPGSNPNIYLYENSSSARGLFYFDVPTGQTSMYDIYSGARLILDPGGNFYFTGPGAAYRPGGGPWNATSDERIKTVTGEYTKGLEHVVKLKPVTYFYNGNDTPSSSLVPTPMDETPEYNDVKVGGGPYPASPHYHVATNRKEFVGLVAQELETIFPDMVSQDDGFIDGEAVSDLRTVDTNNLTYALVNSVKELAAQNAAFTAQNAALTARIVALEARLQ